MIARTLVVLICAIGTSCASHNNPYSKFYTDLTVDVTGKRTIRVLRPNDQCRVTYGHDLQADTKTLCESGYVFIGGAEFEGAEVPDAYAEQHGKLVGAEVVVLYKHFRGIQQGSVPLVIPSQQTGTVNSTGSFIGPNGGTAYMAQTQIVQNGTSTINVPFTSSRFHQYGSYWAKPYIGRLFGADFEDTNISSDGLIISRIDPVSPAQHFGFIEKDRITQINNVRVVTEDEFQKEIYANSGNRVNIKFNRNGNNYWMGVEVP